ncbi:MAG: hypothetical protein LBG82_03975 [Clostridiales Family XIII bacterium]|jgi:hypothetical protein|nr:hypothetical protein [Clostridiales Family XIII bacterium]
MAKNIRKKALALITFLALLLTAPAAVFADGTADFNGEGAADVWQYDTANVRVYGYDAFGDAMKNLSPGDARSVNVLLRNNTPDSVLFRLAANPVTGQAAKDLEPYFSGKQADDGLLDRILIDVRHGATPLYSGTLRGLAGSGTAEMYTGTGVSLGTVSAGYSGTVTVDLSVPTSLGSDYMNTLCAIEWRFIALQYNETTAPPPDNPPTDQPATPPTKPTPPTPPTPPKPPSGANITDKLEKEKTKPKDDSDSGSSGGTSGATDVTADGGVADGDSLVDIGDTPVDEIPETDTPQTNPPTPDVEVDVTPPPKQDEGSGGRAWALFNLLLTILAAIQMLWLVIRYTRSRDRERYENELREQEMREPGYYTGKSERYDWRVRRKNASWIVGLIGTVCLVILFILTEDMRLPMEYVNRYTICYVAVNIVVFIFAMFTSGKREYEAAGK